MARLKISRRDRMTEIVHAYRKAGQPWPATRNSMAIWAMRSGLWRHSMNDAVKFLARELGRALRDELFTDKQGRRVRLNHSYPFSRLQEDGTYTQEWLWADYETIEPDMMHASVQNRRTKVTYECRQLKTDVDSYNDNKGTEIELSFDFTEDLKELEQPPTYEGMGGSSPEEE